MINFRLYEMNEHKLLASNLSKEEALNISNNKKYKNKRLMMIKHDTEKGDEIVDRTTGESYMKGRLKGEEKVLILFYMQEN